MGGNGGRVYGGDNVNFYTCRNLAEYVLERENKKHQLAQVEVDIFKKR